MATTTPDESDYDSSSFSTIRTWTTNLSFGSHRLSDASLCGALKPHKANQAAWEAIKSVKGQVGLDHFRLLRRLGSGDIGNVYLCQLRSGSRRCFYAMKVVDREAVTVKKKLQRAEMEKEILGMVDHPFLPTLYSAFEAKHYSCLVMEFCPGGDLYVARQRRPAQRFSISSARFYAAEIILALEYLHMMGIVYRDLKPENVLIREDGHIMLSDFDLSFKCEVVPKLLRSKTTSESIKRDVICSTPSCMTPLHPVLSWLHKKKHTTVAPTVTDSPDEQELVAEPINGRSKSFVGTHEYLAPEVISGQGHGSAVDWWALGVFLYELLYGVTPFKGESNEKTLINILKMPLGFPRTRVGSSKEYEDMVKVQNLISKLLVKNPKKRIGSLMGSAEIKRHEFFIGVNWALIRSVKPPEVPSDKIRRRGLVPNKLSKKAREAAYQIPRYFDYF